MLYSSSEQVFSSETLNVEKWKKEWFSLYPIYTDLRTHWISHFWTFQILNIHEIEIPRKLISITS